jgi:hypothetical protein
MWGLQLADDRYAVYYEWRTIDHRVDAGLWLAYVGLVVIAGLLFGLAAWFPFTKVRYLWSRLFLAALALLPLAHFLYVFGYQLPRTGTTGGWLGKYWYVLSGQAAQSASAALVGVALASGFRTRPREADTSSHLEPR